MAPGFVGVKVKTDSRGALPKSQVGHSDTGAECSPPPPSHNRDVNISSRSRQLDVEEEKCSLNE